MIFVTGATGNIGSEIVRQLVALGQPVRALSRSRDRAAKQLGPKVEIVEGDLNRPDEIDAWLEGVDRLFVLSHAHDLPNVAGPVFEAAKRAGVRHVVLNSSSTVLFEPPVKIGQWHATAEAKLEASGLQWTMLRPGNFDSNALRWAPTKYLAVDAALAQTSRAPSAVELGCSDPANPCRLPNALAGDPPLKQVIARTIEGGINADIRGITFRLGVFRTVSRDDILFVTDDPSGYGYFRNFGKTRRQGIDVDIAGKFGTVRVTAHYTLLDATYRSAETVDGSGNSGNDGPAPGFGGSIAIARGDRIPLIPRNIFKAAIGWDVTRFLSLDIDMIAVSGMYARGNENNQDQADGVYYLGPGKTQPYALVNAGAEVRPAADVTLFVQIDNLFDKKYATAAQLGSTGFDTAGNFVSRPFSAPVIDGERPLVSSTFYSPGAPRSVQVGARVKF